jgi:hypothetical protein
MFISKISSLNQYCIINSCKTKTIKSAEAKYTGSVLVHIPWPMASVKNKEKIESYTVMFCNLIMGVHL